MLTGLVLLTMFAVAFPLAFMRDNPKAFSARSLAMSALAIMAMVYALVLRDRTGNDAWMWLAIAATWPILFVQAMANEQIGDMWLRMPLLRKIKRQPEPPIKN